MNTYDRIMHDIREKGGKLPCMATGADGEICIIERGRNDNGKYIRTETAQNNGWIRINYYYENGDAEELFNR